MGFSSVVYKRLGTMAAAFTLAAAMTVSSTGIAQARHHGRHHSHAHHSHAHHSGGHHHRHVRHAGHASANHVGAPPFSSIVVDVNSGHVLEAVNENELRHPASVTKVMTLYLLFEQLERGRISLDSSIRISEHAAAQDPSKLGLRPGQSIEVDDAIKAIVTKSANDIAVAIAEAVGGSEEKFAQMMTRKSHALGMKRTEYHNASGLPDPDQWTTAHDLAILGRAIQDRFPKYYGYFSTRSFYWAGRPIGNHNHLLGRVEGMDGIKTGYTKASGFNLLTSVRRDGRHIVAVVMGGRTAAGRDQIMANLIEDTITSGSRTRTAVAMAETEGEDTDVNGIDMTQTASTQTIPEVEAQGGNQTFSPAVQSAAPPTLAAAPSPMRPVQVGGGLQLSIPTAPINAVERPRLAYVAGAARPEMDDQAGEKSAAAPSGRIKLVSANDGSTSRRSEKAAAISSATPAAVKHIASIQSTTVRAALSSGRTKVAKSVTGATNAPDTRPSKPGWMIQIGATDDAAKANELLARAKGGSTLAASAKPFTEKVQKGKETLWRARFAGLQEDTAETACKQLKKSGFACIPVRN